MKVLSFDVGIKNLAYCLMEWNDDINEKNNLKVHSWDLINLVTNKVVNNFHCMDTKCDKKIKSYVEIDTQKYYFCTKHFTKKNEYLKDIIDKYQDDRWIEIQNGTCCKCEKSCKKYYVNGTINKSLCKTHYTQFKNNIMKSIDKLHTYKDKKVNDMETYELKLSLIKALDERKDIFLKNIDMILIENQPSRMNPKMKAIADTLYTWFMIRGVVDKNINNASVNSINFISPSNKLKEFDQSMINVAKKKGENKYALTKSLSVKSTKTMLTAYGLNEWVKHLTSYGKQDDLSDSFLQGWYVLNNKFDNKMHDEWIKIYNETVLDVGNDGDEYELNDLTKMAQKKK